MAISLQESSDFLKRRVVTRFSALADEWGTDIQSDEIAIDWKKVAVEELEIESNRLAASFYLPIATSDPDTIASEVGANDIYRR